MFYGDLLMRRVTEFIDRVFEIGIFNYRNSTIMHLHKLHSRKIAVLQTLHEY